MSSRISFLAIFGRRFFTNHSSSEISNPLPICRMSFVDGPLNQVFMCEKTKLSGQKSFVILRNIIQTVGKERQLLSAEIYKGQVDGAQEITWWDLTRSITTKSEKRQKNNWKEMSVEPSQRRLLHIAKFDPWQDRNSNN